MVDPDKSADASGTARGATLLDAARLSWEQHEVAPTLQRNPERSDHISTPSGIPIDRLYVPSDLTETYYLEHLGFPGEFPFTRGIYPTMYRGRPWTMRQYAGFGTARESNIRYRYLLSQGQSGLSVAFDLPTQMGFDSDADLARGEVGRTGVAISSLEDMQTLLQDLPLERISTSMTINATAAILLSFYLAVAESSGVPPTKLRGTIQNDILKEYIARGTYIFPPRPSMRLITDTFAFCQNSVPNWNTISISGYHIREAGSTATQEIAFTLANGIAYVEAAIQAGLHVDAFAPQLSFFFNVHNNFLEEIAKFRAARRLWANIMKRRFGSKNPRSQMLRFHSQTAGSTLTAQQPNVNVIRVTLQALAAVLGGTQSLHTNSLDEALALPTAEAAVLALRTQQVISLEAGVSDTIDPLGGSYAIEQMTDRLEAEATAYLNTIDAMGGMVAAIEQGYPQREIQDAAYRYQLEIESNQRSVVGVNVFQEDDGYTVPVLKIDPSLEREQVARLLAYRRRQDRSAVEGALKRLEDMASGSVNLLPPILAAVKVGATLGEISAALKRVFGCYEEVVIV